jgi:mxaJ protein
MSSASKRTVAGAAVVAALAVAAAALWHQPAQAGPVQLVVPPVDEPNFPAAAPDRLRVCADPNNLPFSDDRSGGFENEVARLIANDLGRSLSYYWQPQRRGFVRNTLNAGACDVVMGVPSSLEMVKTTKPYYRSSYVFVTRADRRLSIRSIDDARLRRLQIGIPIVGDDYENPPPAQALAARHIVDNVHGYPVYGDYSKPGPSWGGLEALTRGDVDVAIAWGPLAGYFARHSAVPLSIVPMPRPSTQRIEAVAFDIAIGVRRGNNALAAELDAAIDRHRSDIDAILARYGVPIVAKEAR